MSGIAINVKIHYHNMYYKIYGNTCTMGCNIYFNQANKKNIGLSA